MVHLLDPRRVARILGEPDKIHQLGPSRAERLAERVQPAKKPISGSETYVWRLGGLSDGATPRNREGIRFQFGDGEPTTISLHCFVAGMPWTSQPSIAFSGITRVAYDHWLQQIQMESHFESHCSILNLYATGKFELHVNLDGYAGTWWEERYQAATDPGIRVQVLRAMPYDEYLQTPEWLARRQEHLKRSGHRCQVCNAANTELHVHHRTYERRGNESPSDLVTLCRVCHELFHTYGRLAKDE